MVELVTRRSGTGVEIPAPQDLRLNIGCGGRRLDGYLGIDAVSERTAADIVATADNIPLPDGCAQEIIALHLWEHFYRFQCDDVIKEWRRLLKPGGVLILELPNLIKCCQNILSGKTIAGKHPDQIGMWGLYGDPREGDQFMSHRWGWTPESICLFLKSNGFSKVMETPTQWHPVGRLHRDMRIEAIRK